MSIHKAWVIQTKDAKWARREVLQDPNGFFDISSFLDFNDTDTLNAKQYCRREISLSYLVRRFLSCNYLPTATTLVIIGKIWKDIMKGSYVFVPVAHVYSSSFESIFRKNTFFLEIGASIKVTPYHTSIKNSNLSPFRPVLMTHARVAWHQNIKLWYTLGQMFGVKWQSLLFLFLWPSSDRKENPPTIQILLLVLDS